MSWSDDANKALALAGMGIHALEAIGPIVKGLLGDSGNVLSPGAMAQLSAVGLAIDAVQKGLEGKISLESVEDEISHLKTSHQSNIDATKSELDKKFPT